MLNFYHGCSEHPEVSECAKLGIHSSPLHLQLQEKKPPKSQGSLSCITSEFLSALRAKHQHFASWSKVPRSSGVRQNATRCSHLKVDANCCPKLPLFLLLFLDVLMCVFRAHLCFMFCHVFPSPPLTSLADKDYRHGARINTSPDNNIPAVAASSW